jgi:hypothetical protein
LEHLTGVSYWRFLLEFLTGVSYWSFLLEILTGVSYWRFLLEFLTGVSYWSFLLEFLTGVDNQDDINAPEWPSYSFYIYSYSGSIVLVTLVIFYEGIFTFTQV